MLGGVMYKGLLTIPTPLEGMSTRVEVNQTKLPLFWLACTKGHLKTH